jgi:RHH-type transcriptional regulator, proline utilization regulon repressor / proline dehydrogenase / delta 1-pyrroline-5-carboxylate dehydrogenase
VAKDAGARARKLLQDISGRDSSAAEIEAASVRVAAELFSIAEASLDAPERARRRRLARLLDDPRGQLFSVLLTDRVARDKRFEHAAEQLRYLVAELGAPKFMTPLEQAGLRLGSAVGSVARHSVGRLMAQQIRREVEGLVFPVEPGPLAAYLKRRQESGIRVNVNHLGEEVLGEAQAEQRLDQYIRLLQRPEVETISVKLSSIFSQTDLFAWESSRSRASDRLRQIYRVAASSSRPKLVYLDMEAYRDLHFTVDLVQRLLDEPEFLQLTPGLVLQAYIPDSLSLQRSLITWAQARRARGGEPLRLRIVKGANLAAERVHSSRMNWALPIYASKHEVDANYKRMLYLGTEPRHADAVHLGIASHNIFDLALGLVLRAARDVHAHVSFEVLEGMANSVQQGLSRLGAPVLTYAPVVSVDEMDTAVAYLIRRLDENTASENYLRHAFSMRLGDAEYSVQAERFRLAHRAKDSVSEAPRRNQNRFVDVQDLERTSPFRNEADTDFSVKAHRDAVTSALAQLVRRPCFQLASEIAGSRRETRDIEVGFDPSRPAVVPYRCHLAGSTDLDEAVASAERARGSWAQKSAGERAECARRVARALRRRRAELIAAILLDAGKRVAEADSEVSEAIDFAEYYLRLAEAQAEDANVSAQPLGVVLVTSPWNFPLAIPLSGVLAALLGGNGVIFKPAMETAFVGERLASLLWEAGVPREVLQLVLCRDEAGSHLLRHPGVRAVVLTGATSTAQFFLEQRPGLELHAETGGKNAMIISGLADRELAIRDLVASAFGYAGQKCSAASLAILVPEVYDDLHFRSQLRDAAASLVVGSAWDPPSHVTPLIRPPGAALMRGLTELETGESWLLEPCPDPNNARLWSPGIKLGIRPGSFAHRTELFGPVLSVLRADDFEHALELANGTSYGLVAGLHSLDEREQARFLTRVACGNLYVNRPITGAIVGRQPFGGHKASSVGPGAKAGGPNYVAGLQRLADAAPDADAWPLPGQASPAELKRVAPLLDWAKAQLDPVAWARLFARVQNYAAWRQHYFGREHVSGEVLGQDNLFSYRPCSSLLAVLDTASRWVDLLSVCAAARLSGCDLQLSLNPERHDVACTAQFESLGRACHFPTRLESALELARRLDLDDGTLTANAQSDAILAQAATGPQLRFERLRWLGEPPNEPPEVVLRAAARGGCHVSQRPVLGQGRHELLFYYREQTISADYHRYGHLGRIDRPHSAALNTNSSATFSPSGPAARGP